MNWNNDSAIHTDEDWPSPTAGAPTTDEGPESESELE